MSYTKRELVLAAFEEIGIAEYEFDISPEQLASATSRLDSMVASWTLRGISLSYPLQDDEDPDLASNIPDWARVAVITNLAVQLAPSFGKTATPETKILAKDSLNSVFGFFARPKEMQIGSIPKGAGYKSTGRPFTQSPESKYLKIVDEDFDPSGGPL